MTQLLRATIPVVSVHAPGVILSREHADAAMAAVKASSSFANIQGLAIFDGIDMLTDSQQNLKASRIMEETVNRLRGELYVGGHDDPARRFEIHQLLMTAGFYARAANMHSTKADPARFISNHYNFDVRRDKVILGAVKDAAFGVNPKESSNGLLADLFRTERHLFGTARLQPIGGKQYLMPGVSLRLVKTEEELKRLLELPPVKDFGNFELSYEHDDLRVHLLKGSGDKSFYEKQHPTVHELWQAAIVKCKPEVEAAIAPPPVLLESDQSTFRLRVLREGPKLSFIERLKETLLQLWVYWFSFWVLFWMVDEEVITLVGLLFARWQQMSVLKAEAKRTSGKVYMATSRFC